MRPETYKKINDGLAPLRGARGELDMLAAALDRVGNGTLASSLVNIAVLIDNSILQIYDGLGDACRENVAEAEQASANMMRTALAVATLRDQTNGV